MNAPRFIVDTEFSGLETLLDIFDGGDVSCAVLANVSNIDELDIDDDREELWLVTEVIRVVEELDGCDSDVEGPSSGVETLILVVDVIVVMVSVVLVDVVVVEMVVKVVVGGGMGVVVVVVVVAVVESLLVGPLVVLVPPSSESPAPDSRNTAVSLLPWSVSSSFVISFQSWLWEKSAALLSKTISPSTTRS